MKTSGNASTSPIVILPFKCATGAFGGFAVIRQKFKFFFSFKLYGFHKVNFMPSHVTLFQAIKIVSFPSASVHCACAAPVARNSTAHPAMIAAFIAKLLHRFLAQTTSQNKAALTRHPVVLCGVAEHSIWLVHEHDVDKDVTAISNHLCIHRLQTTILSKDHFLLDKSFLYPFPFALAVRMITGPSTTVSEFVAEHLFGILVVFQDITVRREDH